MLETLLTIFLVLCSLFLILIVLVQRGRGGGLAGAFGGMGGQSAFGTRAGDVFTKITIGVAVVWVLTAGVLGIMMRRNHGLEAAPTAFEESEEAKQQGDDDPEIATQPEDDGSTGFENPEFGDDTPMDASGTTDGTETPAGTNETGATATNAEVPDTPSPTSENEGDTPEPNAGDGTAPTSSADPTPEPANPESETTTDPAESGSPNP